MHEIGLFCSTFVLVFSLGLQSRFVNTHQPTLAFFNSLMIGIANLVLFKLAPDANGLEIAAYLAGGPLGIVCSMKTHRHLVRLINPKKG